MFKLLLPAIHLFGLLAFIAYKTKDSFFAFLKTRHLEVFEGLNRSKTQTRDAETQRAEIETRLRGLGAEKEKILAEWKEKEKAQTEALKQSSERVVAQMRKDAEQNKKILSDSLGEEVLRAFRKAVLTQAEAKIKQKLSPETLSELNKKFISEVSRGAQ